MWSRLDGISDGPNCPCAFSKPANNTGCTFMDVATDGPNTLGIKCHAMYAYGLRKSRYMASFAPCKPAAVVATSQRHA